MIVRIPNPQSPVSNLSYSKEVMMTDSADLLNQPYAIEYYYTARWGYADEFVALFKKNHLPVLLKQVESGRFLSVTCTRPRYHTTEDGRWDYRVTIVFKNVLAAHESPEGEAAIKQTLYPDQAAFQREEQRRFEILLAHWDLPIVDDPVDAPVA